MIDINLIRENAEEIRVKMLKKVDEVDFTDLLENDKKRKELILVVEELKAEKNRVSKEIPELKKAGKSVDSLINEMQEVGEKIKKLDEELNEYDAKIQYFLERLPNIPDDDLLAGGKENNKHIREFGKKPEFDFQPKNHVDLATSLGLIDYERGAKLAGNGFWIYKGVGAQLEWALLNYFVSEHLKDGYEFIMPPHILTYESGYTAGQFPKFEEEVFVLEKQENKSYRQFLAPTAETALINLHRDEILKESELPKKYFGYTPCYRSEAGSYRAEERGMIRGHQFNKIEMFQFTKPEDSDAAFLELVGKAEKLVEGLGLHYKTAKLAAGDCSHAMARTYDIEVWIPSMEIYKEVSSASNAREYQARRGNMKFRREDANKTEYLHTLNASGLATSRILPAILEQYQQKDGSVVVPEVLRKFIGIDVIKPV
ncbi:MAG TPA: serine--tRNA ligase [Clostridiales bacterium]|nr:MAG: serine--tRNA ligase [Clostridiales bacterium GWD2_32_59]HAN10296.1 serine--tRNA ligase [Clostridiales bacterium]